MGSMLPYIAYMDPMGMNSEKKTLVPSVSHWSVALRAWMCVKARTSWTKIRMISHSCGKIPVRSMWMLVVATGATGDQIHRIPSYVCSLETNNLSGSWLIPVVELAPCSKPQSAGWTSKYHRDSRKPTGERNETGQFPKTGMKHFSKMFSSVSTWICHQQMVPNGSLKLCMNTNGEIHNINPKIQGNGCFRLIHISSGESPESIGMV